MNQESYRCTPSPVPSSAGSSSNDTRREEGDMEALFGKLFVGPTFDKVAYRMKKEEYLKDFQRNMNNIILNLHGRHKIPKYADSERCVIIPRRHEHRLTFRHAAEKYQMVDKTTEDIDKPQRLKQLLLPPPTR